MTLTVVKDGAGTGKTAKVNSNNQLLTKAVTSSVEHFANQDKGKAYHILVDTTGAGADSYVFHVENTGEASIVLESFGYYASGAEQLKFFMGNTGTVVGGSLITPVNVNTGSARTLKATVNQGSDLTGISGGYQIDSIHISNGDTDLWNFEMDLVLEPGGTLSIATGGGGVLTQLTLYVFEAELK